MKFSKRHLPLVVLALFILIGGAYLGAGYLVFTRLATVIPHCDNSPAHQEFTPDNFLGLYRDDTPVQDFSPYWTDAPYREVSFSARNDDIEIKGWFIENPEPTQDAVIVVHGFNGCRYQAAVLFLAGTLSNAGYNVLALDLRNHGESEIDKGLNTIGNEEYLDVLGAYDWLLTQGYTAGNIGLVGTSLGASTAINAFGAEQGIAALWEDSGFAEIPTVFNEQLQRAGYPTLLAHSAVFVGRLYGVDLLAVSPLESIQQHNNRPVYITHGTQEIWVQPEAAYKLRDAVGTPTGFWIIEGARHVEGLFLHHAEYSQRLVEFFDNALQES